MRVSPTISNFMTLFGSVPHMAKTDTISTHCTGVFVFKMFIQIMILLNSVFVSILNGL